MNLTEREFFRVVYLCLKLLWLGKKFGPLDVAMRVWLTIYTVAIFGWKRYFGWL